VVAGRPVGPTGVYAVGAIDVVGLIVMAAALFTAGRAVRHIGVAARSATV
jgi:hypothetical protein